MTRKVTKFFLWCHWNTKNISYSQTFEASDASERLGHVVGDCRNFFRPRNLILNTFNPPSLSVVKKLIAQNE